MAAATAAAAGAANAAASNVWQTRGGVSTLHPSYSQYVTGRPQDFVLQATVASDISDTIAKDDEYYNDTTPAPI